MKREYLGWIVFCAIVLAVLGWFFTTNDVLLTGWSAPRVEAIRRQTFEQSKAYRDGQVKELRSMQFAYEQADDAHRVALRQVVLHQFSDVDDANVPSDLRAFLRSLENPR